MTLHPLMRAAFARHDSEPERDIFDRLHSRCAAIIGPAHLIGSGGEGLVYASQGRIHKFIMNWSNPHHVIETTAANLTSLGARVGSAEHLYPFKVERAEKDILHVHYRAQPGLPLPPDVRDLQISWSNGLATQLEDLLVELTERGFIHVNLTSCNTVLDSGVLKLVDYGSDCRPLREGAIQMAMSYFARKAALTLPGPSRRT